MKKQRICILGGTGFVGTQLINALTKQGHSITVLTRRKERHRHLKVFPTVKLCEANVYEQSDLNRYFKQSDVVINLIGILNGSPESFKRAHVDLVKTVVAACEESGVKRYLHMSALHADAEKGSSVYLRTKGEGQAVAHSASGVDVTSFRPSVIFGRHDSFINLFASMMKTIPGPFPVTCPDAKFAPIYVEDVVHCFVDAIDKPDTFGQSYDLCGPNEYTLEEIIRFIGETLGKEKRLIRMPDLFTRVLAKLPGSPLSMDNYNSMQTDSTCEAPFPAVFAIQPKAMEAVVPYYIGGDDMRGRLNRMRVDSNR